MHPAKPPPPPLCVLYPFHPTITWPGVEEAARTTYHSTPHPARERPQGGGRQKQQLISRLSPPPPPSPLLGVMTDQASWKSDAQPQPSPLADDRLTRQAGNQLHNPSPLLGQMTD